MSENTLFKDFSPITEKAWKQKIQVDLKGADYNETLIWESPEGINVKPFYTSEDLGLETSLQKLKPVKWRIGQLLLAGGKSYNAEDFEEILKEGVEALVIRVDDPASLKELLLEENALAQQKIYLETINIDPEEVINWLSSREVESEQLIVLTDIIGHLAGSGNWFKGMEEDFKSLKSLLGSEATSKVVAVDISCYQNAGANRVQQLAYGLAHAKEYLDKCDADGLSHISFKLSVDSNYFFEIAKLKALRILWQKLLDQEDKDIGIDILAHPSLRNKSIYDYNVNMLRTATECMSAILGGADTIFNLPYDYVYHESNEFAERIARNQLLILKNESYFQHVDNVASGSYYIESLVEEMVNKSWELFEQIQAGGGFLNQLKQHKIQQKIKASSQKQQDAFDKGEEVLVGSNKYPNESDRMTDQLQKDPFLKKRIQKTLIEPIMEKRLAESLEQNRLDHE